MHASNLLLLKHIYTNKAFQESLLAHMALPESFPCLLPGPHDECCGGRGIPQRPLPTYDEVLVLDEVSIKFKYKNYT